MVKLEQTTQVNTKDNGAYNLSEKQPSKTNQCLFCAAIGSSDVCNNKEHSHLLCKIFRFLAPRSRLSTACLVCKYWFSLICTTTPQQLQQRETLLWLEFDLTKIFPSLQERNKCDDDVVIGLPNISVLSPSALPYWQSIRYLNFEQCKNLNFQAIIAAIQPISKQLLAINVANNESYVDDALVQAIVTQCTQLKSIILDDNAKITSSAIIAISSSCKLLTTISLVNCWRIHSNAISVLLTSCTSLQVIKLNNVKRIVDTAFLPLSSTSSDNTQGYNDGIQYLSLAKCSKVTDSTITTLCTSNRLSEESLKMLSLSNCKLLTTTSIEAVGRFKQLTSLDLCAATHAVTNDSLLRLIEALATTNTTPSNTTTAATTKTPNTLQTSYSNNTDTKVTTNLKYLSISKCSRITDEGINLIAKYLLKLQLLDISYCSKVTDKSIYSISNYCSTTLVGLNISHCFKLTEKAICKLIYQSNENILSIIISFKINNPTIQRIISKDNHLPKHIQLLWNQFYYFPIDY